MIGNIDKERIRRFETMIEQADRIITLTHVRPDGDALGSSLGMFHFLLSRYNKTAKVLLPTPVPDSLKFLVDESARDHMFDYETSEDEVRKAISECDLAICLDFNTLSRIEQLGGLISESSCSRILIDHHEEPGGGFDLSFSVQKISSTCELLFHILMATDKISQDASRLPHRCAYSLMTGMTTDTNNFSNSTYPSTLEMASALIAAGVDRDDIIDKIERQYTENRLRLLGHVLKDRMTIMPEGVSYIVLDKKTLEEYNIKEGDTEGFVNIPLSLAKVSMSIMLKEDKDRIRVSVRSKAGVSARLMAKSWFNGGGHEQASGGTLHIPEDIPSIEMAADYIENAVHSFFTTKE